MLAKITVLLLKINLFILVSANSGKVNVKNKHSRVVGGTIADITDFPHAVFLLINEERICGSSIVDNRILLSAAHCFNRIHPNAYVWAFFGNNNPLNARQVIRARRWVIHRDFSMAPPRNDICLIYLNYRIRFGPNVRSLSLSQEQPKPNSEGFLAGWGITEVESNDGPSSAGTHILKSINQVVRGKQLCQEIFGTMEKSQFCAGYILPNNMPYRGDSGSSLVMNGRYVGVASYGRFQNSGLVVYESVADHITWIRRIVRALRRVYG